MWVPFGVTEPLLDGEVISSALKATYHTGVDMLKSCFPLPPGAATRDKDRQRLRARWDLAATFPGNAGIPSG